MARGLHVGTDWFTGIHTGRFMFKLVYMYVQAGLQVRTGWFTCTYRLVYMYVQAGLQIHIGRFFSIIMCM